MKSAAEWRANGVGVAVKSGVGRVNVTYDPEGMDQWIEAIQRDALESAARLCDEEAHDIMGAVTSTARNLAIDIRALIPQEKP